MSHWFRHQEMVFRRLLGMGVGILMKFLISCLDVLVAEEVMEDLEETVGPITAT